MLVSALAGEGHGTDAQPVCRGAGEGLECSATENEGNAQLSQPPSEEEASSTVGMLEEVVSGERQGVEEADEPSGASWAAMAPADPYIGLTHAPGESWKA